MARVKNKSQCWETGGRWSCRSNRNNKSRAYIPSSKIYKEQDNVIDYVRQTGIDAVKYEAWIMELIFIQNRKITFL